MAKRGRKKWPSESRLPPRGFYRADLAALLARRPDGLTISDKAFRLYHVIQAYSWDGSGCDLTDSELGRVLDPVYPVSREWVVRLRGELRAAGLLRESLLPGGRRLLEPVRLGFSGLSTRAEGGSTGIGVKPSSQVGCEAQFTPEEEEGPNGYNLPPPGSSSEEGGMGGGEKVWTGVHSNSEFVCTGVHTNSGAAAIAAALRQRGVFPEPAETIAGLMAEAGFGVEEAVTAFLAHMLDTGDSVALTTWRLKRGLWETSQQVAARVGQEARLAAYARSATPDPAGPDDEEPADEGSPADIGEQAVVTVDRSAAQVWQDALDELELELTRATFDSWLRHTRLIAFEDGTFVVAVSNGYARDWLESRLRPVILRALTRRVGDVAQVRFVVAEREEAVEE